MAVTETTLTDDLNRAGRRLVLDTAASEPTAPTAVATVSVPPLLLPSSKYPAISLSACIYVTYANCHRLDF